MVPGGSTYHGLNMILGQSKRHRHRHNPQHRTRASTWPLVAVHTAHINTGSSTDHGHSWPSVVTQFTDINTVPGCCSTTDIRMSLVLQHCLKQWTVDTKENSRGQMNHRGVWKRSNPENEYFFFLDILLLLRTRTVRMFGTESSSVSSCCTTRQRHVPQPLVHHHCVSSSDSLYCPIQ